MKKSSVLFITLLLALGLCLTACGGDDVDKLPDEGGATEHIHSFTEWKVVERPNCIKTGTEVRYCDCGEKQTETIPTTETHTEVIDKAVAPTCTETGLTEGKHCAVCGLVTVTQDVVQTIAHTEIIDEAVPPTCTESGLTEGKHCAVCNEILVKQGTDPIIPHTYTDKYDESCNVCGNIRDAECAHKEIEIMNGYAATCTAPGLTDGEKCKKCGEIFLQQTVINATGHTEVIDEAVPATCTESGLTEGKHCSVCNEIIVKQEVAPTVEHSPQTTYGIDDNYHWSICTVCENEVNKTAHQVDENGSCSICEHPILATRGIEYSISEDGSYAMVVGYTGTATKIRIADSYQGMPVTTIYNKAFKSNESITSVIIPDSVTTIGYDAFCGCSNLTSVVIPDSVTDFGSGVLYKTKVQFNEYENCKYLGTGDNPYSYLISPTSKNLSSYTIHKDTNIIADSAFDDCDSLTSIVIPDSVINIGSYAFDDCDSLTSIVIPDSVTTIGYSAFSYCDNLTSAVIGNGVTTIGQSAFAHSGLASVVIGNSVTRIELDAFEYSHLKSVVIPDSVTYIGSYTFYQCTELTTVVMGSGLTYLANGVFYLCDNLESVYINDLSKWCEITFNGVASNPIYYAENVYVNNKLVTDLVIPEGVTSISDWAFSKFSNLTSVVIPDSVTTIGSSAFYECDGLTSVVIGNSVTTIGNWAFDYCDSLKDVYYTGSGAEWNAISIGSCNDDLRYATKHYNYTPEN